MWYIHYLFHFIVPCFMWYTCTSSSVAIPTTYIWDFRAEMIKYNAYFRGVLVGKSTWINVRLSLHSWLSSCGLLVKINYGVWGVLLIINIWFLSYSYGWLIMYWYTNISQIWPHIKIINRQWMPDWRVILQDECMDQLYIMACWTRVITNTWHWCHCLRLKSHMLFVPVFKDHKERTTLPFVIKLLIKNVTSIISNGEWFQCTPECGRWWVRIPVGSNQRL